MLKVISRASFQRSSINTATFSVPALHKQVSTFTAGNRAYHRIFRIAGRKEIHLRPGSRGILLLSTASAAESFRSTCGSERGAPEYSKQRSPAATPHVGQGTANNCFAVRSRFLIWIQCPKTNRKTIPYRTLFAPGVGNCRS
jgi:hypothetical protein